MTGDLFPERIETERLSLTRLSHEHVDLFAFYRICSADEGIEEVTRYMPWGPHSTVKETAEFVDGCQKRWDDGEGATYAIRPKEGEEGDGEIAGACGLTLDWDRRSADLGLWLRKRFWGRGYSGERAAAMIDLAFERLDLELVSVTHHVENGKSRSAIERYVEAHGGKREGTLRNWVPYGEEVADEVRYSISREEYERTD
ncbi:GNAT family N-acetyltransferase [Natronorarus salvus]|uniref:GNAT family N-acetyltransferase n=1 Tax=Natronorarus salvus TaxID=3117733 RepID=UPI002F2633AC